MNEQWKPIKGFEGFYEVSSLGNVRSLDRPWKDGWGNPCIRKGKVLAPQPNSRGYKRIELKANGKKERHFVHRLVAIAFVENPNNLPVVNHKDFNIVNNCADNLEWTTQNGNYQYSFVRGRYERTAKWKAKQKETMLKKVGKAVVGTDQQTGEKIKFISVNDVVTLGFQPSCVSNCCNGKRKSHGGYTWGFCE